MTDRRIGLFAVLLTLAAIVLAHPWPPLWQNGAGAAIHHPPVAWPNEPADPAQCGASCGDWLPYTRFGRAITDPRTQDPSNGGTAPQNYVNVSSSCSDKSQPSIYYYLHRGATQSDDVLMFRWRVEQPAHTYGTGQNAGNYSASSPWSSALWTVLFDVDGTGYRTLAAHLNGSSGSPAEAVDTLAGIWSDTPSQSIDYLGDPNVHLLGHNPTAFIGSTSKVLNYQSSLTPTESWPNGSSETSWDYGTTRAKKVTTSPCTEYFIDYQIPVAMLDAQSLGGPRLTRDTPISMLFCTANSLQNPFQKDCAINRTWSATAGNPAPFGDYVSFNKTEPYQQPIVSSVAAQAPNTCPGSYTLTAKVQDALALQAGAVVPSVQSVEFYYWQDKNGDGTADAGDTGSAWTHIGPSATRGTATLTDWTASWDASALPKGKYLIGVQALDDAAALDDDMTSTGVDNRTFSYLTGDSQNRIYIAGSWEAGQQAAFQSHSPAQTPSNTENWYGNPDVTGTQVAVVGTAINACGIAPSIALSRSPASVAAGGTVSFTVTISNPSSNSSSITLDSISQTLPAGFSYVGSSTSGASTSDPSVSGQTLTWVLGAPLSIPAGNTATLSFSATASSTAGTYNSTAGASTSFGPLTSTPASIVVDSARLSLSTSPSAFSVPADGSTTLTFTLRYSNDSSVGVTTAQIINTLPAGTTYGTCSGGTACNYASGDVTFTLGTLAAGANGSVTYTLTVPSSYNTTSLVSAATLSATAPDSSTVNASASTTVAVTGIATAGTPAMSLTKTAGSASIAPGGTVTYTLTYENYGTATATNVVLTDTLPAGMTYSSCSDSCNQASGIVTWNLGSIAAGASGSRTVTVTAATPFTATNPSVNSASIDWDGGSPVTATANVGVTGQACSTYYFRNTTANVGFDGTQRIADVSPVPVSGDTGSSVTVTAPVSGASFLEALRFYQDPQTLNNVPFDGNITTNMYIDRANGQGLNIRTTVYDYDTVTGGRTQLAQNTQLFNGSTKGLLSFSVTPSGTLAKDHRLLWVYEARSGHASQTVQVQFQFAGTTTNAISGGSTFAGSNATYCITPPAALTLSSTVSDPAIDAGTTPTLTYTLRYSNTGGAQATNLSLASALPSGFTNCQYSTDGSTWATCSAAGSSPPSHTFSIASLAAGASGTYYVRGTVPAGTVGGSTLTSNATLSSDQTSSIAASAATSVIGAVAGGTPALAVDLSADRTTAAPGQSVTYTLTLVNTGSAAATNVVATNTVPASAYFTYVSGSCGGCGVAGSTLTWPTLASLAAGASQSYTYTMLVGTSGLPAGVTSISDSASASADGPIVQGSNTVAVTLNGNPALSATLVPAPAIGLQPGDTITYTLTVQNDGAADASDVTVHAAIPGYTSYRGPIAASQGAGTFDAVGNAVDFALGTVASGASATATFVVAVNPTLASGNTLISASALVTAANAAQTSASANATATAAPLLVVTNTAPAAVALPSAVLTSAAAGTTLFVDRTSGFELGQLIRVDGTVARIVGMGARSLVLDAPISAISGTPVYGAVTLTLAYRNDGNADASAATLTQALPAGLGYYDAIPAATSSPITGNAGDVQWALGTLGVGAGGSLEVLTFPTGSTGTFNTVATLSASNASDATATAVTTIGGLTIAKTTSTSVRSAGQAARYVITATNSLGAPVVATIADTLPSGFTYQASSATVAGVATEPTFDVDDTAQVRPTWSNVSIPANDTLVIVFRADIDADAGPGAYQNEVSVDAPAGVGVLHFDPLATSAEDVTVLPPATGVLQGTVFKRAGNSNAAFDAATDEPLDGVQVRIHRGTYDCTTGSNCYVTYTDSNGQFAQVVTAATWDVSVVQPSGGLQAGWLQIVGQSDNAVIVPDQGTATDDNGFSSGGSHTVGASAGANGSISPASRIVNDGDTTTFTVTPDTGYTTDTATGCGGSLSGNTYTTAAVTTSCNVSVTFTAASYAVDALAGTGGTIDPANATVTHGQTTSFTVTPASGYSIASVTGCGGSLSGNTYTTAPITAACTVNASFTLGTYTVDASAGSGGTIGPASASVAHGQTTSFTVTPSTGYSIATVTGCSGSLSGDTYTTGAITSACAVTATFTATLHTVVASAGSGGTVAPGSVQVAHGLTTSFAIAPDSGYAIAGVSGCNGSLSGTTFTTGTITGACAVTVAFTQVQHTVTASAGSGGSISPASSAVAHGATTTFTVTADTGYAIAGVSGCGGSLNGSTFTTGTITSACAVTATFAHLQHTVTASAGSGGSISPASSTVAHGETATFTVTADTGYAIAEVTGCNGSLSGTTFTTGAISNACLVNASFARMQHTVTATADTGGTISPATSAVNHGESVDLAVTVTAGYSIVAVEGCNGTLSGATFTTGAIVAPCAVHATLRRGGPYFETPAPARVNARSLFTAVPPSIAPKAFDEHGTELTVTLVGNGTRLRPGRHTLTWSATDVDGNTVTAQQQFDVWPTVSLSQDLVLGYGSTSSFDVTLNGDAPEYPFAVSFAISGDALPGTHHTLAAGTAVFTSGLEKTIGFATLPTGASAPDRHILVTLDPSANIGERGQLDVRLVSANLAPQVSLIVSQAERTGTLVASDGGLVALHAVVIDGNSADAHTLQWTAPAGVVGSVSVDGFDYTVDPSRLSAGLYSFTVVATDNGIPAMSSRTTVTLAIRAVSPLLGSGDANENGITDALEGWTDAGNGIPLYLNRITAPNVLPEDAPVTDSYLVEGDAGVHLRVGPYAQYVGSGGARLTAEHIPSLIAADTVQNVGGHFDVLAPELTSVDATVRIVLPQRQPVPQDAVYRLWDEQSKRWFTFAESANETLMSAPGEAGFCPPPGSDAYRPGLNAGDWCVQVQMQDGGSDDVDGQRNASLKHVGGVGVRSTVVVTGTSEGNGGGGAMNGSSLWMMLILGAMRYVQRRQLRRWLACIVCVPALAAADEPAAHDRAGWFFGANGMYVHGTVDASDMDARLARQGYATDTHLSGQTRFGWSIGAGYRRRYVGAELAYTDLGRLDSRVSGTTPISDEYLLAIARAHPRSGTGPQANVLGFWPVSEKLEIVGKAGLLYWRNTQTADARIDFEDDGNRSLDPLFGLGLSYRYDDHWTASALLQSYRLEGERLDTLGLGVSYRLAGPR